MLDFSVKVLEIEAGDYDREIRFRFAKSPRYFMLTKQKNSPIEFKEVWVIGHGSWVMTSAP